MRNKAQFESSLRSKNILIIENNRKMADLVATTLVLAGASTKIVSNSADGLRSFYDSEPDLIFIDADMPNAEGWQLYDHIRGITPVPIIMLTGSESTTISIRKEGRNKHRVEIIRQPFHPNHLLNEAKAILSQ
ncbi:MAG: response regulator [Chloroflexota bacterium]